MQACIDAWLGRLSVWTLLLFVWIGISTEALPLPHDDPGRECVLYRQNVFSIDASTHESLPLAHDDADTLFIL
jgi:hypothetical protein